jgi:hypothetical protein
MTNGGRQERIGMKKLRSLAVLLVAAVLCCVVPAHARAAESTSHVIVFHNSNALGVSMRVTVRDPKTGKYITDDVSARGRSGNVIVGNTDTDEVLYEIRARKMIARYTFYDFSKTTTFVQVYLNIGTANNAYVDVTSVTGARNRFRGKEPI